MYRGKKEKSPVQICGKAQDGVCPWELAIKILFWVYIVIKLNRITVVVLSSALTQQHKSLWEPTRQRKHQQYWELQGCKPCQGKDTAKAPGHHIPNSPGATALLGRAGRELTESKATELLVLHPPSSSTHSKSSPFEKSHVPLGSQQMLCRVCGRLQGERNALSTASPGRKGRLV